MQNKGGLLKFDPRFHSTLLGLNQSLSTWVWVECTRGALDPVKGTPDWSMLPQHEFSCEFGGDMTDAKSTGSDKTCCSIINIWPRNFRFTTKRQDDMKNVPCNFERDLRCSLSNCYKTEPLMTSRIRPPFCFVGDHMTSYEIGVAFTKVGCIRPVFLHPGRVLPTSHWIMTNSALLGWNLGPKQKLSPDSSRQFGSCWLHVHGTLNETLSSYRWLKSWKLINQLCAPCPVGHWTGTLLSAWSPYSVCPSVFPFVHFLGFWKCSPNIRPIDFILAIQNLLVGTKNTITFSSCNLTSSS